MASKELPCQLETTLMPLLSIHDDRGDSTVSLKDSPKLDGEKRLGWRSALSKCNLNDLLHPDRLPMRLIILALVSGTTVSSYFSYNSTAAVSTKLMTALDLSQFEYGLLYSLYSLPNLVVPLMGGFLVDRIGVRSSLVLFLSLITVGSGIVALAPYMPGSFGVMLLGRFIFGLGAEASYVAQDTMCVLWFGGKTIAFAFGVISGVERATEFLTFNVLTADVFGDYRLALWCTFLVCVGSLICGVVAFYLDRKAEQFLESVEGSPRFTIGEAYTKLSDIRKFKPSYWMLLLVMMCLYGSIFPFLSFASNFLQIKYNYTEQDAARLVSVVSIVSMILSPILGYLIDVVGKRIHFVNLGNLLQIVAFMLLGFTDANPIFCSILVGIAYSLIPAALWPSLPIVVEDKFFATASGLALSMSNIAMIPAYGLVGQLVDKYQNIEGALALLVGVSCLGLLFGGIWQYFDYKEGSPCNARTTHEPIVDVSTEMEEEC